MGGLMPALALTLCFFGASPAFADLRPSDEAARLLAAAKEATGGARWDAIITWHQSGQIAKADHEETFVRWVNVVRLRNAAAFTCGQCPGRLAMEDGQGSGRTF